jgi:DNA-directed RNA polymerase subunit M/transcription elongation factor TFIIS
MNKLPYNVLSTEAYLIYLRKSRADNQDESVEEVLAKHEAMLQELAERELGGRIPEHCIIREIVSGETIDERPEMRKVLAAIENPAVAMVLVVEPQRLSRGDLEDCGRVVNAFRYSKTKVMTLQMTYDLTNKMQRKFFEQELMRGNDYLEYTKEILLRGRIASVKKGNYIANTAPFGFDKVMDDIGPTLEHGEYADAVRLVFDMFVNQDKTPLQIARHLDSLGVKPMRGSHWEKCSIRAILKNEHYAGWVKFGTKKTERLYENGQTIKKRHMPVAPEDMIIEKGRHTPIVSQELFDAAQAKFGANPKAKEDKQLRNVLSTLMFCHKCGKAIALHPYKKAKDRYECRNRSVCGSKSVTEEELLEAVIYALENEELPELEVKLKNDDGKSRVIQQKQLEKLRAELAELQEQEDNQYDLLERKKYTEEVFERRNKALHVKMDEVKSRIYELNLNLPEEIDYEGKIVDLKKAIVGLRDDTLSLVVKNKLLRTIIKRIEYEYLTYEGKGKVQYKLHIQLRV